MLVSCVAFLNRHLASGVFILAAALSGSAIGSKGGQNTLLLSAAAKNDLTGVKQAIGNAADVNAKDSDGRSALVFAAKFGNLEMVKLLVSRKADVNGKTAHGSTALMFAANAGHADMVRFLIYQGASMLETDDNSMTPLCYAAAKGHLPVVKVLLEEGGHEYYVDKAYRLAAEQNHLDVLKALCRAGYFDRQTFISRQTVVSSPLLTAVYEDKLDRVKNLVNQPSVCTLDTYQTALQLAEREGHIEILAFLQTTGRKAVEKGAEQNRLNDALRQAVRKGEYEQVKALLYKGADTFAQEKWFHGQEFAPSILGEAVAEGNIDIVNALLDTVPKGEFMSKHGYSLVSVAAHRGQSGVMRLLLDRGAAAAKADDYGLTPLMAMAQTGDVEMLDLLVRKGANVNAHGQYGDTPLIYAAKAGQLEAVRFLIKHGAEVNSPNQKGHTALSFAENQRWEEVVKFLVQSGATVPANAPPMRSPLFDELRNPKRLEELIKKGADVNEHDGYDTPLSWALNYSCPEGAQILIRNGANVRDPNQIHGLAFPINDSQMVEVFKVLVNKGADINLRWYQNRTPLMMAAESGQLEIVEFLISKGAQINLKDGNNQTALDLARSRNHPEVAEALEKAGAK